MNFRSQSKPFGETPEANPGAAKEKKEWTQTDMAVYLDMNRGHISDIERGKREAGIITLQVIATGLNTTMANLLKGL
jgi:transcriptional regulator with XRE-family HTH domain